MFAINVSEKGGATKRYDFDKSEVTIGRIQGNDVLLPKGNVSKRHARIVLKDGRFVVVDLKSTNGTYVNGRRITSPLVIKEGHKVYIGDFVLTLQKAGAEAELPPLHDASGEGALPPAQSGPPAMPQPPSEAPSGVSASAPSGSMAEDRRFAGGGPTAAGLDPARLPLPEPSLAPQAPSESQPPPLPVASEPAPVAAPSEPPSARPGIGSESPSSSGSAFRLDEDPSPSFSPPVAPSGRAPSSQDLSIPSSASSVSSPSSGIRMRSLKEALQALMPQLASRFDVTDTNPAALHDPDRRARAQNDIEAIIEGWHQLRAIGPDVDRAALADLALGEAVGFGALESLLTDDSVKEIAVDGPDTVEVDRGEGLKTSGLVFSSAHALHVVALRLVAQSGAGILPGLCTYDVTLPYGPRVAVVLPPVASRGPIVEVRRVSKGKSLDDLLASNALNDEMAEAIQEAISARKNIAVIGAIGDGVTTLLGAMASLCGEEERLVTVEDVADISIDHPRVISLSSGAGLTGTKFSDVIRQANRLRSDRLVIDDLRPTEVFTAFAEIASRAPGNFLGLHGNHGDPIPLLKAFVRVGAPGEGALDLINRAVDLVIEVARPKDGHFRVVKITEIVQTKAGSLKGAELFSFGDDGFSPKNGTSTSD